MRRLLITAVLALAAAACAPEGRAVVDLGRYQPKTWVRRIHFRDGTSHTVQGRLYFDKVLKAYVESDQDPMAGTFRIKNTWHEGKVRRVE